jgi:hypothetical protein
MTDLIFLGFIGLIFYGLFGWLTADFHSVVGRDMWGNNTHRLSVSTRWGIALLFPFYWIRGICRGILDILSAIWNAFSDGFHYFRSS